MRELDFDIGLSQDAGRTLYRAGVIFFSFMAYKNIYTQVSPNALRFCTHLEQNLWAGRNCYIQIQPRGRYFLSAVICSFVPYLSTLILNQYEPHYIKMGAADGALICSLTITTQPSLIVGAAFIGASYGWLYKTLTQKS